MSEDKPIVMVKFPMVVKCWHPYPDREDGEFVEMEIEEDDPEVPTYWARCPKCGREIIIAFAEE